MTSGPSPILLEAVALHRDGKLQEAIALYRTLLVSDPNNHDAHNLLGVALHIDGNAAAAEVEIKRAIELQPAVASFHFNLGQVLVDRNDYDAAANCYTRALALRPDYASAAVQLGRVLFNLGRPALAVEACRRALEIDGDNAEALNGLGASLRATGDLPGAESALVAAVRIAPRNADALNNLANLYMNMGRVDEAGAYYRRARDSTGVTPAIYSNALLGLHYEPGTTRGEMLVAARGWAERFFPAPAPSRPSRRHTRPKLGFVSPDFYGHPVGWFALPVIEALSKSVDIVCYANQTRHDEVTGRFKQIGEYRQVDRLADAELARQIEADRIDVLFDLAGHTANNRLPVFAMKPAPTQIAWIGYVGTTGLPAMDAIIADRHHIPPGEEADYVERVIRMPDSWICALPPHRAPDIGTLPAERNGYITFGCFSNPAKISGPTIRRFASILAAVPNSRLILKYRSMPENAARLAAAGIDLTRVSLEGESPHHELLSRYNDIDIVLDTAPYSGGMTTIEALWMGAPVVTSPGDTFSSRHATSFLSTLGLSEFIADDFAATAAALADDLERLRVFRATIRNRFRQSALCDYEKFGARLLAMLP